jgi:hypothetical protein
MQELDHSPLGGSAAHRFLTCAGSFLLQRELYEQGLLENSDSFWARKGTAAHTLASRCLEDDVEPWNFVGEVIDGFTVVGSDHEPDEDLEDGQDFSISVAAVDVYFNHCKALSEGKKGRVFIEERIHLPNLHPLLKGAVDFGYMSRTHGVHVRDYKNGEGIAVSARGNVQLMYYGFLLIMANPWFAESAPDDMSVSLGIVQPNFYGEFEEPDVWTTDLGSVKRWGHEVLLKSMERLTATKDIADTDFVFGNHCVFCPVLLDCPKMHKAWKQYVDANEEIVQMLDNDELAALYANREAVKRFGAELDKVVEARLMTGQSIETAKLVDKRGRRVWKTGAEKALASALGDAAYEPRKLKSPAKVEKLSSRGKEMSLELAFKNEDTGVTVAPITDPRPAANRSTSQKVFGHFETTEVFDL